MKNHLKYRGYLGTVDFSANDSCLFGKIIGINDLINYEGESVTDLKKAFEDAVEDYLETCKVLGKEPNKTFKGVFNVRTSTATHKGLVLLASRKKMNLNQLADKALTYLVKNEEKVLEDKK